MVAVLLRINTVITCIYILYKNIFFLTFENEVSSRVSFLCAMYILPLRFYLKSMSKYTLYSVVLYYAKGSLHVSENSFFVSNLYICVFSL